MARVTNTLTMALYTGVNTLTHSFIYRNALQHAITHTRERDAQRILRI